MKQNFEIKNILLADDDVEECFLFKIIVFKVAPDIQVQTVNDGDQVAEALSTKRPDLLFLDLNMPCKNGIQCLQELKDNANYRSIPVIVYSTSASPLDINQAYGFGASLYIQKPSAYKDLLDTLYQVFNMNWDVPQNITEKYYSDNKYRPFSLDAVED